MLRGENILGGRTLPGLILVAVLAAAVSGLPAGIGNLGRVGDRALGSQVEVMVYPLDPLCNPIVTTHVIDPNELVSNIRDDLVAQINADPNFDAVTFSDPADPNFNSFRATKSNGQKPDHLKITENDGNIDNVGVSFSDGRDLAILNKVAQINASTGGNYVLSIALLNGPSFSQTFNTTLAPNNTAAGLNNSIKVNLIAAGFSVDSTSDPPNFLIRKPVDKLTAVRVSSTDTGVEIFSLDLTNVNPAAIPTVSQIGMFVLALLLTGAAIFVMRRKAAVVH